MADAADQKRPVTLATLVGPERGSTGLDHFGGFLSEEWLNALRSFTHRIKVYKEMRDNDPMIGAVLFAIEMLIRGVEWDVEPAKADEGADAELLQQDAAFLWSCMNDMDVPWVETIADVLSMLPFGFALHEVVMKVRRGSAGIYPSKYSDGKIGWAKLAGRSQDTVDRWDIADNGDTLGVYQMAPPKYQEVYIPAAKLLHFRTTMAKRNPEGRSILRNCYRPWKFKKRLEELEGIGVERDLAGLPVLEVPVRMMVDTASPSDVTLRDLLRDMITSVRRNDQEGVLVPQEYDERGNKLYDFRLMSAGGSRQLDTSAIISRYDQRIAMTVLADFILLGHEKVGSFALSSDKTNLFATALGAWLNSIADTINGSGVPQLFAVNGVQGRPLPRVTPLDIETPDLAALGTFIAATSGAGMDWFPSSDGALERQLARYANLPYRSEAVELVEPAGGGEAAPIGEPQKTNKLLETVGGIGAIIELSQAVASKTMPKENAVAILMEILGLEAEAAERMVSQAGGTE